MEKDLNNLSQFLEITEHREPYPDEYFDEAKVLQLKADTMIVEIFNEEYYSYQKWGQTYTVIKKKDIPFLKEEILNSCGEQLEKIAKKYESKAKKLVGKVFQIIERDEDNSIKLGKDVVFTSWFLCNPSDTITLSKYKLVQTTMDIEIEE